MLGEGVSNGGGGGSRVKNEGGRGGRGKQGCGIQYYGTLDSITLNAVI